MTTNHQELADYLTYYCKIFEPINDLFSNRLRWKGHWRKKVYMEVIRGISVFHDTALNDSSIWIQQITTPDPEQRQQGYMRRVMELLQEACAKFEVSIYLFPDSFEFIPKNKDSIWENGIDNDDGLFGYVGGVDPLQLTRIYGRMGFLPLRSKYIPGVEFRPWLSSLEEPAYVQVHNEQTYRKWQRPMFWPGCDLHDKRITRYRLFGSELPKGKSGDHLRDLVLDPECLCDHECFMDVHKFWEDQKVAV